MTVKELIQQLQEMPNQEALLVVGKDAEGNDFSPLEGIDDRQYRANSTYSGTVGYAELSSELIEAGYTELFDNGDILAVTSDRAKDETVATWEVERSVDGIKDAAFRIKRFLNGGAK